jgi:hypothetical protein
VPTGRHDPTLDDGCLDELATRHGVTIAEVRRMMGPQRVARRDPPNSGTSAAVGADLVDVRVPAIPTPTQAAVPEDSSGLDDGRLEELAASLGVTFGDVRRMIEVAGPRRDGSYRGQLDVAEIRRRYEAGESLATIGAAMHASDTAVRHAMVRAGIPTRPGPRPAGERRGPPRRIDVDDVRRRSQAGETIPAIARAMGASPRGVRLVMDRNGIGRRSRRSRHL